MKLLEMKLLRMFLEKVQTIGSEIEIVDDPHYYKALWKSGRMLSEDRFYLYIDDEDNIDMTPIVYHLIDTEEGYTYAKITRLLSRQN